MTAGFRSRRRAIAGFAIYLAPAGVDLLTPVSYEGIVCAIAEWVGTIPRMHFLGSAWIEFEANIALFVPMGFLPVVFRCAGSD